MFLHNFKYEFLSNIRQKDFIFWMLCFPIILGTFFYIGFGNIYDRVEIFKEIPVVIVEVTEDETFNSVVNEMQNSDERLFDFSYVTAEEAEKLLSDGDVTGMITVDKELSLTVSGTGIKHTILKSFLDQYLAQKALIMDTAANAPEKLPDVIEKLTAETDPIVNNSLSGGNMNPYDSYFQNLITMAALFGCMTGVYCATRNQGNLSAIGARKCVSPKQGFVTLMSSLLAAYVTQLCAAVVATTFVLFVLRINMGGNYPMIYLSDAIGTFAGISLGFLIGSIGRASENFKTAIATAITMFCCFLSGLMIGDMKANINAHAPIVNKLNPAALISDLFYCLTIYDDYSRYIEKAATLLIISVISIIGGLLLTRRKTYESL